MNFYLKSLFWAHCEGDFKGVFEKNIKWESKFGEEIQVKKYGDGYKY